MAKREVSKHSRAARRNQVDENEVADLAKLPRVSQKADIANYIVRTTDKNEELLQQKLHKKEVRKTTIRSRRDAGSAITKPNSKINRAISFGGKLSTKIEKSINKGMRVQKRKMTWEQLNEDLNKSLKPIPSKNISKEDEKIEQNKQTNDENKVELNDDIDVDTFFNDDDEENKKTASKASANKFALLSEEVEA